MSLEPAVAALVGCVILGERLGLRAIAAIQFVTVAARRRLALRMARSAGLI